MGDSEKSGRNKGRTEHRQAEPATERPTAWENLDRYGGEDGGEEEVDDKRVEEQPGNLPPTPTKHNTTPIPDVNIHFDRVTGPSGACPQPEDDSDHDVW